MIAFSNPRHVYVRWSSTLDAEHEDPDNLGGIIHRFDYQTEAGELFHRLVTKCGWKSGNTGDDFNETDICIEVAKEEDWFNWLTSVGLELNGYMVIDSYTGEIYAFETTQYLYEFLEDKMREFRSGKIDQNDFNKSVATAIEMLKNIHLG